MINIIIIREAHQFHQQRVQLQIISQLGSLSDESSFIKDKIQKKIKKKFKVR